MNKDIDLSFEEFLEKNERRIYYQIHKMHINDTHQEFYQEGLWAMWEAYRTYKQEKGSISTYFNAIIRNRMIDLLRKKAREQDYDDLFKREERAKTESGNLTRRNSLLYNIPEKNDLLIDDPFVWNQLKNVLTHKQWIWVYCYIILDMPIKEIAKQEGVTCDAVKSWGKQARKKLGNEKVRDMIMAALAKC